jgi:hypothetical protein
VEGKNEGRKRDKNTSSQNAFQKFHLWLKKQKAKGQGSRSFLYVLKETNGVSETFKFLTL